MTFGDSPSGASASDYDRFVDWGRRLEREGPFFRRTFAEADVRRVADVGCGTGRHAVIFASWGLDVAGVDPSAAMLEQARAHAQSEGAAVRFVQGGFGDLARLRLGTVDAVTCTGNALPHVAGLSGLAEAFADFAAVLRPGGVVILHLLNHDRLLARRARAIPPVVRDDTEGTWVFLRVMDYPDEGIGFDFATLHRPADAWETGAPWDVASRRSVHTALPTGVLVERLESGGFAEIRLYGDHTGKQFDPGEDESVIVVATRQP